MPTAISDFNSFIVHLDLRFSCKCASIEVDEITQCTQFTSGSVLTIHGRYFHITSLQLIHIWIFQPNFVCKLDISLQPIYKYANGYLFSCQHVNLDGNGQKWQCFGGSTLKIHRDSWNLSPNETDLYFSMVQTFESSIEILGCRIEILSRKVSISGQKKVKFIKFSYCNWMVR